MYPSIGKRLRLKPGHVTRPRSSSPPIREVIASGQLIRAGYRREDPIRWILLMEILYRVDPKPGSYCSQLLPYIVLFLEFSTFICRQSSFCRLILLRKWPKMVLRSPKIVNKAADVKWVSQLIRQRHRGSLTTKYIKIKIEKRLKFIKLNTYFFFGIFRGSSGGTLVRVEFFNLK